jgi:molybdenum cofactor synthesis domain-containing protein
MQKGKVISVNISEKKGTIKIPVKKIELSKTGVINDAHSGMSLRQVSLLAKESIEKFAASSNKKFKWGEFAENITTEGIELHTTGLLDRFIINDTELEVTQIGKTCHGKGCAIFTEVGACIMPKEGIFARVIREGVIKDGDIIDYHPKIFKTAVITLSDRASKGEYPDKSGPRIKDILEEYFLSKFRKTTNASFLIPDDSATLKQTIEEILKRSPDIIFTTGGTGIGSHDITVDTVQPMLDREIPGIMDMIRIKYGSEHPAALISRSVAGVIGNTLVFTLPGSVRAVEEYMSEILKNLQHLIYMLHDLDSH